MTDIKLKGGVKMNRCYYRNSCCGSDTNRNFLTKEEKIEMLKEYKEAIDKESTGVSERIKELEN